MKIIDRAAKAISNVVSGMTASNALSSSTLYRGGFGLRGYDEPVNAQSGYMAVSSVFACITAYAMNAPQVTMQVQHLDGTPWPDHPAQWVIRNPNEDMSERTLSLFNCIYKPLGGATQLHLLRSETNRKQVIGLRPYTTNEIAPVPLVNKPIGRNSWIDYYLHTPLLGTPERVERRDIVTLPFPSINPINPQMPLSPLAAIFLDVAQDKAVTKLPTDFMNNGALLSYVFALGAETGDMPDGALENIKADLSAGWTNDNRFKPMLLRAGGTATMVMPDFKKMDWDKLGQRPELRICSALRCPIRYIGFSAGIDASTSDNYVASWISFVKDAVIGQALLDADTLTNALTREQWSDHPTVAYGMDRRADSQFKIVPDTSQVQALKVEQLLQQENARKNYETGAVPKDEFRADIGKAPVTDGTGGEYKGATAQTGMSVDESGTLLKTPNVGKV